MLSLFVHIVAAALALGQPQQLSTQLLQQQQPVPQLPAPRLSTYEYIVGDTAKYENFRLKVINESDSLVYIERAEPSCGCVLVTVQHAHATKEKPGDIYIGVTVDKMSFDQPITVDVYTNVNRTTPLRLYLRRQAPGTVQPAPPTQDTVRTYIVQPAPKQQGTEGTKKRRSQRKPR